jgi:predicted amidophosphoribosyltransferase
MIDFQARLDRERRTIRLMIGVYCQDHHETRDGLCETCQDLHTYAMQRIEKCPFKENKPTCARCPVHCYKPEMRERVRQVMRYAGPRMLLLHPILTAQHYWDELTITREN